MQRYAFPLKPPNYLPKNFFLNKSLINRDLLGNALRKGSRSLSICMPTSLTVAPAPFFVLLMFRLLFSISVIFYWFSIYSQKVALIDATPLRVLSWRAILLAGHSAIYQARQGVVFFKCTYFAPERLCLHHSLFFVVELNFFYPYKISLAVFRS